MKYHVITHTDNVEVWEIEAENEEQANENYEDGKLITERYENQHIVETELVKEA